LVASSKHVDYVEVSDTSLDPSCSKWGLSIFHASKTVLWTSAILSLWNWNYVNYGRGYLSCSYPCTSMPAKALIYSHVTTLLSLYVPETCLDPLRVFFREHI
jgi:hypothetical protein